MSHSLWKGKSNPELWYNTAPASPANPAAEQSPWALKSQTAYCLHIQICPPSCTTQLVVEGAPSDHSANSVPRTRDRKVTPPNTPFIQFYLRLVRWLSKYRHDAKPDDL